MKKRVKVQVINADWEIKKYEMRQKIKNLKEPAKQIAKVSLYCFAIGVGFGLVDKMRY